MIETVKGLLNYYRGWRLKKSEFVLYHPLCDLCIVNDKAVDIQYVGHLVPWYNGHEEETKYMLRDDEDNMISLCPDCYRLLLLYLLNSPECSLNLSCRDYLDKHIKSIEKKYKGDIQRKNNIADKFKKYIDNHAAVYTEHKNDYTKYLYVLKDNDTVRLTKVKECYDYLVYNYGLKYTFKSFRSSNMFHKYFEKIINPNFVDKEKWTKCFILKENEDIKFHTKIDAYNYLYDLGIVKTTYNVFLTKKFWTQFLYRKSLDK